MKTIRVYTLDMFISDNHNNNELSVFQLNVFPQEVTGFKGSLTLSTRGQTLDSESDVYRRQILTSVSLLF